MNIRRAHTAEHIFMRALYTVNKTVRVLKVEHKQDISHIVVEAEKLDWNDILKSAKITNMIILENRPVSIENYDSFEEAKKKYPELRAYEERIRPPIRIVVIKDYDYAACRMPHVKNTGECIMFLPISYRREKGKYIIDFLVAEQAFEKVLNDQALLHKLAAYLEIDSDRLMKKVDKLLNEEKKLAKRIRKLSKIIFENAEVIEDRYKIKIIKGEGLEMKIIGEMTNEWINKENNIVIALNKNEDRTDILIASSKNINKDLREIARKIFEKFSGKGGGKKTWIMGYVKNDKNLVEYVINMFKT